MGPESVSPSAEYEARIVQEERNRIAKVIHDGVAQNLALLMLKMEVISRLADIDQIRMKAELAKAIEILEATTQELRSSILSLRTPDAESPHVERSAQLIAERLSQRSKNPPDGGSPDPS